MNDNKILPFPVVPRPVPKEEETVEEIAQAIGIEEVIERVQEQKLTNILIIGMKEDGKSYYDADNWRMKDLIFLVHRLLHKLNMTSDAVESDMEKNQ